MPFCLNPVFRWALLVIWLGSEGIVFSDSAFDLRIARWSVATNGAISPLAPDSLRSRWLFAGALVPNVELVDAHRVTREFAAGAPRPPLIYRVDRWTVDRGLPSNRIETICQSQDGYLWVGTLSGLARFDGTRFVVYHARNTPVLEQLGDNIRALACDIEGNMWVATGLGLLRQKNGQFVIVPNADPASVGRIKRLALRRAGGVWIGADTGLWLCSDQELRHVGEPSQVFAVVEESAESVVACFIERTSRMDLRSETWTEIFRNHPTNALFRFGPGSDLSRDRNGRLILGTHSAVLLESTPPGTWKNVAQPIDPIVSEWRSLLSPFVVSFGEHVALAAEYDRSLSLWVDGQRQPFATTDGRTINNVSCLFADRDGSLWIGAVDSGLIRLRQQALSTLATAESGNPARVLSVCEGADGSIWCGTRTGVFQWGRRGVRVFDFLGGPEFEAVNSILRTTSGEIWGTFGKQGLLQFADFSGMESGTHRARRAEFGTRCFEHVGPARALFQTGDGTIWMGTKSGLFRGGRNPGWFTRIQGLPHNDVRAIHEDRLGQLWIGTFGGGLCRLRDPQASFDSTNVFEIFNHERGLSHNRVWSIHEDESGVFWLGTAAGLNRFQEGRFFSFAKEPGMIPDELNHILEDDAGRFWLSSTHGIVRVDRRSLNAFADGLTNQIPTYHYNTADGMLDAGTNGEQQPSGCRASDGRLYFVTQRGVVMIDPRSQPPDAPPPNVLIEEVVANGAVVWTAGHARTDRGAKDSLLAGVGLTLEPGSADSLEIRFTAVSISALAPPRIEYRLEGFEKEWRLAPTERVATYTNLKPKTYSFSVRAADSHWIQNDSETAFNLVLERHFWTTMPFLVGCGVVLVAAAGAFHAIQIRRQRSESEIHRVLSVDQERARIARDLHDQLGAKLSKLALNTGSLPTHQQGVRETLEELRKLIWRVNPDNDSLASLADFLGDAARQYLGAGGIELSLQFPCPLPNTIIPGATRRQIAAAFHEALRNAIQHSGASKITVTLKVTSSDFRFEITDDGRGFDVGARSGTGTGLANMRSRLAEVNGQCLVDSRPGKGTRVLLQARLSC